ncbi:MAG: RagB/SusD family nutrient uptake outer membrane protein [Sphaerochaetaceae bacterium]|nr:RagB/SusD family nutrient uptake outer membrane protein [Sphaerochaetaceae bacterium]
MKKNITNILIIGLLGLLVSCNDFLDTMPDNRAEVNTVEKVTKLLVSAYPTNSITIIAEMSSDNALDNGANFVPENMEQEDAYLWNDITTTGNDAPKAIWDAHYGAIAAANQALQAIEEMGDPGSLQPQKGEALIARAYSHFVLSTLFCLPFNPETADSDMGIPYSESPETKVKIEYERGSMAELYEKINADIEAGLPLINDAIYSVPKYHFNKKAANAFAARFNLYYHQYDNVIKYANEVVGTNPAGVLRNWAGYDLLASNWQVRADAYINASETANLLLLPVYSGYPYVMGPYNRGRRYGHARDITMNESVRAPGLWGAYQNLYAYSMWGYEEKLVVPKVGAYFEYTDKVAGIGFLHGVYIGFTTDETLLCRAEAYILKGESDKGVADINTWIGNRTRVQGNFSKEQIVAFYSNIPYMPLGNIETAAQRTVKKELNPRGFVVTDGEQEELIHCVLHLRRVETIHDGLRWSDIKRYGIEIAHNRDGQADDILLKDDPRRAVQLPQDVIEAGLAANPRR